MLGTYYALPANLHALDKLISQSEVIDFNGSKAVRKKFSSEVSLLKWLPPAIFLKSIYPFAYDPLERLRREVNFLTSAGWEFVKVPKLLKVSTEEAYIVREYVEGDFIDLRKDAVTMARVLSEIHRRGFVMGDVKPTNFLVNPEGVYVIDAEQSIASPEEQLRAWDLVLILFFATYAFITSRTGFRKFTEEFLRTYLKTGGASEPVAQILDLKFGGILMLMPVPHLIELTSVIESLRSEF